MPYIDEYARSNVQDYDGENVLNTGRLNYSITRLLIQYLEMHGLNYSGINDCVGALEGAKSEFYRRVAVPYENRKIIENGDVYPPEIAPPTIKDGRWNGKKGDD